MHENGTIYTTDYNDKRSNFGSIGRGFINNYHGQGYQKTISLDISNPDFFKDTWENEIFRTGWLDQDKGATMIVMEF